VVCVGVCVWFGFVVCVCVVYVCGVCVCVVCGVCGVCVCGLCGLLSRWEGNRTGTKCSNYLQILQISGSEHSATACTSCCNKEFHVLPTQLYLCVLCGSQNKQPLFPYTTLTDWFFCNRDGECLLRGTGWIFVYNFAWIPVLWSLGSHTHKYIQTYKPSVLLSHCPSTQSSTTIIH